MKNNSNMDNGHPNTKRLISHGESQKKKKNHKKTQNITLIKLQARLKLGADPVLYFNKS